MNSFEFSDTTGSRLTQTSLNRGRARDLADGLACSGGRVR
jgi:hypothetical protein